jgi:hypothetical protein
MSRKGEVAAIKLQLIRSGVFGKPFEQEKELAGA